MKLNLYCGLRAIAWIITEGNEVIKHGIKRINLSFDNYYEFIAGLPVSKRINRRMKRQARHNLWRFKSRRENLIKLLLKNFGCQPQHLTRNENLQLRIKGLTEILSPQELTNALMQLQNKRGYKSLRGVSDNENSDYLKEIERHEENLKSFPSIAAYLVTLESSKDIIFNRSSYINEFNAILDCQAMLRHGDSFPVGDKWNKFKERLFNIIYFQNPLKKGKIGKCDYEKNRTVCHASNPLYQEFRIWRDVHNIKIYDADKNELQISFDQRRNWATKASLGSNLTKASCCKDLGFKNSKLFTWYSGNAIAGNPITKCFDGLKLECDYNQLWQDLYSATDNEKLSHLLSKKYQFKDWQINELIDLDLTKLGYADFSVKAIRKLLPLMQSGMKLKEAVMHIYGQVDFENVALRNVVLEQHFESYRSLVERLKREYDINEIQFEIDHLLKQGNKGRKAIAKQKRTDEKFAKENPDLSHYNLLKLKLWNESGGISPYQPDYVIPKEELFTDKYNLDHIVPKSKLYERGMNNQVLCAVALNEKKNRLTGFDFAKELGLNGQYESAIEKFPESKQQFLRISEDVIPENWISKRQNSDYNTKCFNAPLQGLGVNIPNKLINRYLNEWHVNQYPEHDARHYLAKCWVLANMSQATVDYFDNIKKHSKNSDSVSVYNITPGLDKIDFENTPVFMPRVKFSRKTKHGHTPRFGLHGETVFGKREKKYRNAKGEVITEYFYKVRQPVSKLTPAMVNKIMDKAIREKIQSRINEKGNHEDGIASLVEDPAKHNGKPIKRISIIQSAEKIFPLHSTNGNGHTKNKFANERKIDFVFSDKNYCLKVWIDDKGKVKKETLSLMEFMDMINKNPMVYSYPSFNLKENDIVELNGKKYFVIGASDALCLRSVTTLSATDTYKIKADDWKSIVKLNVNQLGETISKQTINGITENTQRLQSQIA